MWVFYFFAAIVIWLGILSLRGGFRFATYVKSQLTQPPRDYSPFASVIVPCRGLEPGLTENLAALLHQEYPEYEVIFVTDNETDPALEVIQSIIEENAHRVTVRAVIAGPAFDSGTESSQSSFSRHEGRSAQPGLGFCRLRCSASGRLVEIAGGAAR